MIPNATKLSIDHKFAHYVQVQLRFRFRFLCCFLLFCYVLFWLFVLHFVCVLHSASASKLFFINVSSGFLFETSSSSSSFANVVGVLNNFFIRATDLGELLAFFPFGLHVFLLAA